MRKLFQHISLLCCLGLAGTLGSCISDDFNNGRSLTAAEVGGEVNLSLNVSVGNITDVRQTRDGEETATDKFNYEQTEIEQEKIKTLRVIIVRPDYTVEFNRLINLKDNPAAVTLNGGNVGDELKFRVSTDQGYVDNMAMTCTETKGIYLIANEASLDNPNIKSNFTGDGQKITDILNGLTAAYYPSKEEEENGVVGKRGDKLDPYSVERWTIYNHWDESGDPGTSVNNLLSKPILDNETTDESTKESYVPMTEFFDIDVVSSWRPADATEDPSEGEAEDDDIMPLVPVEQTANLFVTRNFVKFQFTAWSETEKFDIVGLRFENLMQKEYLFPYNAIYDPVKSINNPANRQIISFQTPGLAGNLIRPYVFKPESMSFIPTEPETPGEEVKQVPVSYAPLLYFCETQNYVADPNNLPEYRIGVDVEFTEQNDQKKIVSYQSVKLPNLPSLPRNTIVKIDLFIRDRISIAANVTLEPFILVELDPDFGDPQPYPGDKEE